MVSDQPMSNDETLKGATNRLQNIQHFEADYFVSIEGGVDLLDNNYEAFAWIVISDKKKLVKQKQQHFHCPLKFQILLKKDMSLEMPMIWYLNALIQNKKMEQLEFLTDNLINRTDYYTHAIILALIPFTNTKLY